MGTRPPPLHSSLLVCSPNPCQPLFNRPNRLPPLYCSAVPTFSTVPSETLSLERSPAAPPTPALSLVSPTGVCGWAGCDQPRAQRTWEWGGFKKLCPSLGTTTPPQAVIVVGHGGTKRPWHPLLLAQVPNRFGQYAPQVVGIGALPGMY